MARARNIKPGFFANDELAEVDPLGRLLFIGLWTVADREGRLEDRPRRIKAEVLPYDDVDIDVLLDQLVRNGFILRYSAGSDRFIQVLNFNKHQNPHVKESASEIPAPDEHQTSTVLAPDMPHENTADSLNLIPDSLNRIPDSVSRAIPRDHTHGEASEVFEDPVPTERERPREARKNRADDRRRAETPIPPNFTASPETIQWALAPDRRISEAQVLSELPKFVTHCRATGRRYEDWQWGLRSWLVTALGYGRIGPNARSSPGDPNSGNSVYEALLASIAEDERNEQLQQSQPGTQETDRDPVPDLAERGVPRGRDDVVSGGIRGAGLRAAASSGH